MKVQVIKNDIAKAISLTSRFVNSRAQLPILGNILVESKKTRTTLLATDLEVSIALSIGSKVEKEGLIGLPARVAQDLFSNLPDGNVSLEVKNESLLVLADNFSSSINGMNGADFPSIPRRLGKNRTQFTKDPFISALSQVLFSASIDESRPVLTGILFLFEKGNLYLTATDGFRLSQKKLPFKGKVGVGKMILPKRSLTEFVRIMEASDQSLEIEFRSGDNQVVFGLGSAVLATRVIEGEFPDFKRIIPKEIQSVVSVDKGELVQAIKLASVFAREAANVVIFSITKTGIEISAKSQKSGEQKMKVPAKVEGDSLEISFNYRFVEEFLQVSSGDQIVMNFSGPNSPGVFKDPGDKDFLHLIMPVKSQD